MIFKALILCFLVVLIEEIACHGRLLQPIARTSAWRKFPAQFPAYYGDNQMFCGGVNTQYKENGGKCGICGESYSATKKFEKGGSMYRDLVVAKYSKGDKINVEVELTANHKGYFQFSVCNVDGSKTDATQQCLDKNILTDSNGKQKITIDAGKTGIMKFELSLPAGLACKHCVFQWKYNAGNSWGTDKVTGKSGLGEGDQEQFYGCSDIQITSSATAQITTIKKPEETKEQPADKCSNGKRVAVTRREDTRDLMNFDAYENVLDDIVKCLLNTLNQLYKFKENIGTKITNNKPKQVKTSYPIGW